MGSTVGDPILNIFHSSRRALPKLGCGLLLAVLFTLLGGCAVVGPDYQTPESIALPTQWSDAEIEENRSDLSSWWQQFNDPTLNQLI